MTMTRSDALPEHRHYRDTGCSESPSCLSCPLPQCKYDEDMPPLQVRRSNERRERVLALREHGHSSAAIARTIGVHKRTVWRLLQEAS